MGNPWFRLYAEFATDPKVQMMSESNQRRIIMLLCMKCSNGDVTLQDEEVAFQLRISNDEWAESKALFMSKNIIDNDNQPVAWSKRQYASDSSAPRVAKHRAKLKEACNVTVTPPEQIQNRTETEAEAEKTKTVRAPRFDAQAHLAERGIPTELSADWIKLRKTKKAEVTKTAIEGIANEAAKAGLTLGEALRECCARGWAGFKADWMLRDGGNARAGPAYQSIHEKRAETIANLTGRSRNERTSNAEHDITGESTRVA